MRILGGLGFFCLCVAATMSAPTTNDDAAALRAVSTGMGDFSTNLYKTIAEKTSGNLIMSPLSVSVVLSMAAFGAQKNTAAQMRSGLHMPEEDAVSKSGYQGLLNQLNNVTDVELRLANKIFRNKGVIVKPAFQDIVKTYFLSDSEEIDFSQSEAAANTINNWAESQTNNRIKDLVKANDVSDAMMVLLNAVYFKGDWKEKFDARETKDRPFHTDVNTVKNVPTMYKKGDFKYGDLAELNASYIIIPYKGDDLNMIIIRPNEINGLAELEKNLDKVNIGDLFQTYEREVKLYLPKFKTESKIDLEEPLKQLGMSDMFSNSADFSALSDIPLKVGKVLQKAFIEVNEEGSEAAAVTGMKIMLMSMPRPPRDFKVDRPYVYAIAKKDLVLFQGHVIEPAL